MGGRVYAAKVEAISINEEGWAQQPILFSLN
jgi:hypothetical protein